MKNIKDLFKIYILGIVTLVQYIMLSMGGEYQAGLEDNGMPSLQRTTGQS